MSNDKWQIVIRLFGSGRRSSRVAFVLLNLRKHPIKLSGSYLSAAEFADSTRVDFQRRTTIRTIQIRARSRWFCFTVAHESPIFTPLSEISVRAGDHLSTLIHGVVVPFGENAKCNRIVESINLNFSRLHRRDLTLVKCVSQPLSLISLDPVTM